MQFPWIEKEKKRRKPMEVSKTEMLKFMSDAFKWYSKHEKDNARLVSGGIATGIDLALGRELQKTFNEMADLVRDNRGAPQSLRTKLKKMERGTDEE